MVAYNPKQPPEPSEMLRPETIAELRSALEEQRRSGGPPTERLRDAIRSAAVEARTRHLLPETLIVQLKRMVEEAKLAPFTADGDARDVRQWVVSVCLRAYFEPTAE